MKRLVESFVNGEPVDFAEMLSVGLIERNGEGYSLTLKGRLLCFH